MSLEHVNCYNCKSNSHSPYDKENGYNLVKCNNCGLLYVNPRPSEDQISAEAKTGLHSGDAIFDKTISYNEKKIPKYIRILQDFYTPEELKEKKWLDIGCGHGEFIEALNSFAGKGISISGIEPNRKKVESARSRGLNVKEETEISPDKKYNIISTLNVFSHLPNPIETLAEWSLALDKDGEIFIETGHSSHLPSKHHNKPYDLPDHLSFANKEIVISILERIGFEILQVKIYRGEFYKEFTLNNLMKEIIKWLLGKKNTLHSFCPSTQHGDMYIRAKKI